MPSPECQRDEPLDFTVCRYTHNFISDSSGATLVATRGKPLDQQRFLHAAARKGGVRAVVLNPLVRQLAKGMLGDYHHRRECSDNPVHARAHLIPSSGILTVLMLLAMCDRVTIYGVGGGRDIPYHYFGNERAYNGHSFKLEHSLIFSL
ncbi:hypothetical protein CBR_g40653, partial [Chara braunii]